ncbi:carbohydrate ABC transporter permease [Rhodoferax aquaticus]|uniref:Sugar ABC transporter permease n=1 Tax=Rhodoferax aquaticus TaxID=2527691 RepID=A0A515ERA8_9BURK|nr:sugar ABC transporter permease [Rhodoferax aquaticus]QDL55180.1 sugar ABC transporter permease [Rhodoferax aquaticus]
MGSAATARRMQAWGLLTPMLVIMVGITAWPLMRTIWLSFTSTSIGGEPAQWVGLENYWQALSNTAFQESLGHTLYFTFVSVSLELVLGVAVGLLLNQPFKGQAFARALLVLPWALPTIVNAMMWRLIDGPEYGALNALLVQTGLLEDYRSWLGDPDIAMEMVIVADVWKNYPFVALIMLASLQSVPADLYEAARLDGAGTLARFWYVTVPGVMAPLSVAIVLRTIDAFKVFDVIYVMTKGGPADSTKALSFVVYQEAFSYLRIGSGAAYAILMAGISALLIALYVAMLRKQEGST